MGKFLKTPGPMVDRPFVPPQGEVHVQPMTAEHANNLRLAGLLEANRELRPSGPEDLPIATLLLLSRVVAGLRSPHNDHTVPEGWECRPDVGDPAVRQNGLRRKSYRQVAQNVCGATTTTTSPKGDMAAAMKFGARVAQGSWAELVNAFAASDFKDNVLLGGLAHALAVRFGEADAVPSSASNG